MWIRKVFSPFVCFPICAFNLSIAFYSYKQIHILQSPKAVSKDGLGWWHHLWWRCQCVNTFHPQMIGSQSQKTSSSSYRVVCAHREGAQKIVGKSSGWTEGRDASQMWDAVMQLICKQWWVQKRAIGVVVNCPIGKAQSGVIAFWIVFAFWLTTPGGGGGKASPCA